MIRPPNNFNKDLSNNKVNNTNKTFFSPLHNSSDKFFNNNLNNNLKVNNDYFNMKIKNLLDNLQNERNRIENQFLLKLEDKKSCKEDFDNYLSLIDKKYNFVYNNTTNNPTNNPLQYQVYNPFVVGNKIFNPPRPISLNIEKVVINVEINDICDILDLIEKYPIKLDVQYNINMQALHNIKQPLIRLNTMIGMKTLKSNIVDQIIYFAQNLHKTNNKESIDFMHTVIYGPPGTGKTEIANIIGNIFSNLGILKNKIFKKATRTELIAGYLGQTAIKTKDLIKSCLGGCLFIDEAYALGNQEKRDSFAKECIDTLCEALSFYKNDIMVIIAGYEKDLKNCFFAYNAGLESRFTWRFNTDNYNKSELNEIFQKKVNDIGWSFEEKLEDSWFDDKMEYFKYFGRDMETLLAKTKIAHSKRVFCKSNDKKRKLNIQDINKGFEKFLSNDEVKNRKEKSVLSHMYI